MSRELCRRAAYMPAFARNTRVSRTSVQRWGCRRAAPSYELRRTQQSGSPVRYSTSVAAGTLTGEALPVEMTMVPSDPTEIILPAASITVSSPAGKSGVRTGGGSGGEGPVGALPGGRVPEGERAKGARHGALPWTGQEYFSADAAW